jgi:hypothetical protein
MPYYHDKKPTLFISLDLSEGLKSYDFSCIKKQIDDIISYRLLIEQMINDKKEQNLIVEAALNKICDEHTTFKKEAQRYQIDIESLKKMVKILKQAMIHCLYFTYDTYYAVKEINDFYWQVEIAHEKIAQIETQKIIEHLIEKINHI